jgi:hypothetical protein
MPLVTVNIPESLSRSVTGLLERIAVALERLAGPIVEYRPPTQSTLKDYSLVTPEDAQRIQDAQHDFGVTHLVVPGSPAYFAAIEQFERDVADACGPDAVNELPWRKVDRIPPGTEEA